MPLTDEERKAIVVYRLALSHGAPAKTKCVKPSQVQKHPIFAPGNLFSATSGAKTPGFCTRHPGVRLWPAEEHTPEQEWRLNY